MRPLRGIQAVTFDVGGTLVEPWPSVGHVYAEVAERHGVTGLDPLVLTKRFGLAWKALKDFRHTREQWAALVDTTFAGLTELPPSKTFFDEVYDRFAEKEAWHVYEDVVPTLAALKGQGLRLAVISNWDERLHPLLEVLDLRKFFEWVVVSCDAGFCKPAREIFASAVERLGLPAEQVLHVGDSEEMDLRGAEKAGLKGVVIDRKGKGLGEKRIRSLGELV